VPDGPCRLLLLGGPLVGAWLHWCQPGEHGHVRGRHEPCLTNRAACWGCQQGKSLRWKGWLSAWLDRPGRHVLAEITEDATRDVDPAQWRGVARSRGWTIILTRKGCSANSPVRVAFTGAWHPVNNLPEPLDPRGPLARAWGLDPDFCRAAVRWTALPPWMEEANGQA